MSRRKDNKGRVLRTGESQRKDLIYQYRYTDALGNRKCIYASDLKTLREKEDELQRSLEGGLDYAGGEITVYELLQRYLSLKCGVRYNTKVGYGFVMNIVQKEPFGARKIRDIKALQYVMGHSDASITLNVYTHASYDHAAEQMAKLVDFPGSSDRQERKMSG